MNNTKNLIFSDNYKLILASISLFLLVLPLSISVTFMQNDDWVHYLTVQNFLNGTFELAPVIGSTFFTQAFLGYAFSFLFGVENLPILTLLFACASFYILAKFLVDVHNLSITKSLVLSLVFFVCPLFFYSILGFMTEVYVVFFLVGALYTFNRFLRHKSLLRFAVFGSICILGFLIKQYFIFLPISGIIYLILRKDYKSAAKLFALVTIISASYLLLFPRTEVMENQVVLESISFHFVFSYLLASITYLGVFLSPVILLALLSLSKDRMQGSIYFIIVISTISTWFISTNFVYDGRFLQEFPNIGNVFSRKGFFPDDISGNKYHWRGYYDVFNLLELLGIFFGLVGAQLILLKTYLQRKISFEIIAAAIYFIIIIVARGVYDRYLLPLVLIGLLAFISLYKGKLNSAKLVMVCAPFILGFGYLNYIYGMDFIGWQKYVWDKAEEIAITQNLDRSEIYANRAWRKIYGEAENPRYIFTFDSPMIVDNNMELLEERRIMFKFSPMIDSKIYVYRRSN